MKEMTIALDSRDEALLLSGNRDQFLKEIRSALDMQVIGRGDQILLNGSEEQIDQAARIFSRLREDLRRQGSLTTEDVHTVIEIVQAGSQAIANPGGGEAGKVGSRNLRPRTDGQALYVRAMKENDLTLCVGPAGTGKTWLAVAMAVSCLRQALIKKIVLVRPAVEAGERLGFLPGDIAAKVNPYLRPLFDALNDMMDHEQVKRYLESDIIEIAPLAYMRGRTLNQAVIIMDEAQNTTISQMKMFLTRMGIGSKIIVTGDITQVDLPPHTRSGMTDAINRMRNIERVAVVHLTEKDIVRSPLVQKILAAYEENKPRR
ncbi:MAG: phosphate starvation-inducible protein PhoH [Gemmataceae bacterium]|nr:phosphate starvation-inducible protein PhoH [Gemmataceae bacterium]